MIPERVGFQRGWPACDDSIWWITSGGCLRDTYSEHPGRHNGPDKTRQAPDTE